MSLDRRDRSDFIDACAKVRANGNHSELNGDSQAYFAEQFGWTPQELRCFLDGKGPPRPELVARLRNWLGHRAARFDEFGLEQYTNVELFPALFGHQSQSVRMNGNGTVPAADEASAPAAVRDASKARRGRPPGRKAKRKFTLAEAQRAAPLPPEVIRREAAAVKPEPVCERAPGRVTSEISWLRLAVIEAVYLVKLMRGGEGPSAARKHYRQSEAVEYLQSEMQTRLNREFSEHELRYRAELLTSAEADGLQCSRLLSSSLLRQLVEAKEIESSELTFSVFAS